VARSAASVFALFAIVALTACSSSADSDGDATAPKSHDSSSVPLSSRGSTSSSASRSSSAKASAQASCSKLTGEPVPASLEEVTCTQTGNADVAKRSYPCAAGGSYFWLSPESADGSDLAPYVGRPGKTWVKGDTSAPIEELAKLVGC
jgi:hypothetical protein